VPLANPNLCILNAGCIGSDGPVRSIRLLSRVPVEEIRTVAMDVSSRTALAMCTVVLTKFLGLSPATIAARPTVREMLDAADAALIIGDPALAAVNDLEHGLLPEVVADLDLGTVWQQQTGLPFVYAAWAAKRDADLADWTRILSEAGRRGMGRREEIAAEASVRMKLPLRVCQDYLNQNVRYQFGERQRAGLELFQRYAAELGLLPPRQSNVSCFEEPTRGGSS
jgi:chorismate dehydratase